MNHRDTVLALTRVQAPTSATDVPTWHHTTDVLVIGFGGAGVTAALQAREDGAEVIAVDRFEGGGATAISGGVVYAAGTRQQAEAGVTDTVEAMQAYLALETDGVVSEPTLRRFCEETPATMAWLERHGVPFEGSLCPVKTSYPTNAYYLYWSGNEGHPGWAEHAPPAPRGHRAKGRGLPGAALFRPLQRAAEALGVKVLRQARATRLIREGDRVVGAELAVLTGLPALRHRLVHRLAMAIKNYVPGFAKRLSAHAQDLEERHGVSERVRARQGVILAAGGFIFQRDLVAAVAPAYRKGMPLGTAGCDGSGLGLGASVGGALDRLDRVSAWRFINPPMAWAKGIFVDKQGERYCSEAVYGAELGRRMVDEHDGQGLLILDDALLREAFRQLGPGKAQWFQQAPGVANMLTNRRTAPTIEALADRIKVPADALRATLATYNAAIDEGREDPFRKPDSFRQAMPTGPYHAMDCGLASKRFPCPTLTLGGLVVDEDTGAVRDDDGQAIPGLYAAGRSAVGVASNAYVSGLSIADCVFSGRRAGRCAAKADPTS